MNIQESILAHLTQVLKVDEIALDANLIECGLSSIAMIQMVDIFLKHYRLTVKTSELMASPTIRSWVELLESKQQNVKPEDSTNTNRAKTNTVKTVAANNSLNPLQRAYLVGKSADLPLGGFSMHDFREYKVNLSLDGITKRLLSMIERHDVLRTYIDEALIQQTLLSSHVSDASHTSNTSNFEIIDLSNLCEEDAAIKLNTLRETYSHHVHDLSIPPWFIWFVRMPSPEPDSSEQGSSEQDKSEQGNSALENSDLTVFTSFDGLIIDGYGISILLDELFSVEPNIQTVTDVEQQTTISSYFDTTEADKNYWLEKINKVDGQIKLPWKKDLETITRSTYQRQSVTLKHTLWQDITNRAAQNLLLANTVLTTVVLQTLANWTPDEQVYLSLPISNSAQRTQVGNHSSFIMLAYTHHHKESFLLRAKKVQQDVLESMSHTSFSGVEIGKHLVKKLGITSPLPVAFTNGLSWKGIANQDVKYMGGITQTPQLAMDIRVAFSASQDVVIDIDYAERALEKSVITALLQAIKHQLETLATSGNFLACQQPLPSNQDQTNTLAIASLANYLDAIKSNLFIDIPEKTALISGSQTPLPKTTSYKALGQYVAKIMLSLKNHGIHSKDVVAICLPKSNEYLYSILACAMMGIIWVPIDVASPSKRLHYLLTNCNATVVIGNQPFECIKTLYIDELLQPDVLATHDLNTDVLNTNTLNIAQLDADENLIQQALKLCRYEVSTKAAYYLYTSGTTGTPKCVVLNHAATANVMQATAKKWQVTSDDVLMAVTPFHHDMSVFELFMPVIEGATLVLPHATDSKNAVAWANLVDTHKVTLWSSVPAILEMLMACAMPEQLASLRLIAQGGDFIKPHMIERLQSLLPNARLFSLGGPTETTIWSIWHEIQPEDTAVIPYGKPLPNNQYHIIKASGSPCPNYVVGTICTSGVNLSNGYLKNGLIDTSELIHIETEQGVVKGFKTSDTGFFREDGSIIFAGRKTGYLKVRGVRIASAEVEKHIAQFASIKNIVVMACQEPTYQENELVAVYQTYDGKDIPAKDIKIFLQPHLPASHIPSRWLKIAEMPLTQNQKINRHALAEFANNALYNTNTNTADVHVASVNPLNEPASKQYSPTENMIVESFSEVLDDSITLDSEILTLDIRLAHMRAISKKIHAKTETNISINELLACKTLKDISDKIKLTR